MSLILHEHGGQTLECNNRDDWPLVGWGRGLWHSCRIQGDRNTRHRSNKLSIQWEPEPSPDQNHGDRTDKPTTAADHVSLSTHVVFEGRQRSQNTNHRDFMYRSTKRGILFWIPAEGVVWAPASKVWEQKNCKKTESWRSCALTFHPRSLKLT